MKNKYFLLIVLQIVSCSQFQKYNIYNNLSITTQFKTSLQVRESFQTGQYNPVTKCILTCTNEPSCNIVALDNSNNCTMYNNQTTLIHTLFANHTSLYSKIEMKLCFDGFYADLIATVCRSQKYFSYSCLSSNECLNLHGLLCLNKNCLFSLPNVYLFVL